MASTEDIEGGPKIVLSVIVWMVVLLVGSLLIYAFWNERYSGLVFLVFLVLSGIGWGIAVGLYQSRAETRAKTK